MFIFFALSGAASPVTAQDDLIVRQLKFEGNESIERATLEAAIATTKSSWFATAPIIRAIGLGEKRRLNQRDLERDVERLELLYRIYGFMEVSVDTTVRRTAEDVFITFHIEEGEPVILTRFDIFGIDSVAEPERITRDLPLRVGEPFNRYLLQASGDTMTARLRDSGYPEGRVFLETRQVDSARRVAEIEVRIQPGDRKVIGDVRVEGFRPGDSAFVIDLMAARRGDLYRRSELIRSQRNIVATESYRFAAVEIDTALYDPDTDDPVPLVVRIVPGARYRYGASIGYGTDDCFRASGDWTIRHLFGRGRLLRFAGRVSKVGVGDPLGWGFERSLCGRLEDSTRSDLREIGSSQLNYTASVLFTQPAFLSPDNTLGLQFFAERRSELKVYVREETGVGVSLTREGANRIPVSVGYRIALGSTEASDANFCAYFNACNPADIAVLTRRQRQGVATAGITRLRVNNLLDPTRGTSLGLQASHSASYTGSDSLQRFTRVTGDFSVYRPLTSGITAAGRIRAGFLLAPRSVRDGQEFTYVPPEQRFYAGGANDVRGYNRNDLGPVVYVLDADVTDIGQVNDSLSRLVAVSPIGGNRIIIANAEVRVPSPVFPSRWRLAAFVDGGAVWRNETAQSNRLRFRVTPGVGLRISTPLGPARLDVAYNGYGYPPGALYVQQDDGSLVELASDYVKPRDKGLTFHLAIGQAF